MYFCTTNPKKTDRICGLFFLFMLDLNSQDIMIAQLVALSDVCETNSPLSEAKHCRWFLLRSHSPSRVVLLQLDTLVLQYLRFELHRLTKFIFLCYNVNGYTRVFALNIFAD